MLNRRMKLIAVVIVFVMLMSMVAFTVYEPFKVDLTLFERFVCLGLLPEEGSFATLKIIREMQMEFAPTNEEYKAAGLITDLRTGGTKAELGWDMVEPKEIVFGDIAKAIIVSALEKLDKSEKLTPQHFSLYEKFVLGIVEEVKEVEEIREVEIFEEVEEAFEVEMVLPGVEEIKEGE